jgi:hypothetical protein
MTKKIVTVLCLAIAFALAPSLATAASFPATLTLDLAAPAPGTFNPAGNPLPGGSAILLEFAAGAPVGIGSPAGAGLLTWTPGGNLLTMMVEQSPGDLPPALSIDSISSSADMDHVVIATLLGAFDFICVKHRMGLQVAGGFSGPFPVTGGTSVDVSGLSTSLNDGVLDIAGGTFVIPLALAPLDLDLPLGSTATFSETPLGAPFPYDVTLAIPFSVDDIAVAAADNPFGFDLWYNASGVMVWEGIKDVPEPGSIMLAAVGLIALVPVARRFRKKS